MAISWRKRRIVAHFRKTCLVVTPICRHDCSGVECCNQLSPNSSGACPFHGDCLEGLASGPAIKARWGASLSGLPADHPAHDMVAWYLAQLVVTLQSIMEPGRVILGGGVTKTPGLLDRVRTQAAALGKGYFRGIAAEIIVPPGLGDRAGLLGGYALALAVTA